jgi:hypothetical protein
MYIFRYLNLISFRLALNDSQHVGVVKVSECLLFDSTFLYVKKHLATYTDTVRAYLKCTKSLAVSSAVVKVMKSLECEKCCILFHNLSFI